MKILHIAFLIEEGKLHADGGIKKIEEVAVGFKYLHLILVLRQLVIHIVKGDAFGIEAVFHAANAVAVHLLVGDGLLGGLRLILPTEEPLHQAIQKATLFIRRLRGGFYILFSRQGAQVSLAVFCLPDAGGQLFLLASLLLVFHFQSRFPPVRDSGIGCRFCTAGWVGTAIWHE